MLLSMETDHVRKSVRKQVDAEAITLLSMASMLEAMDQGSAGTVNLQTYAAGEIARIIQRSVLEIQELIDVLERPDAEVVAKMSSG